ncbi:MAG: hypothetical protein AAFR04_14620 [Pseudomonadota bacterium]
MSVQEPGFPGAGALRSAVWSLPRTIVVGLTLAGVAGAPAFAATISNRDEAPRTLEVLQGSERKRVTIAPGGTVTEVCKAACEVRLEGRRDDAYSVLAKDKVAIEAGYLYFDDKRAPPLLATPEPRRRPTR